MRKANTHPAHTRKSPRSGALAQVLLTFSGVCWVCVWPRGYFVYNVDMKFFTTYFFVLSAALFFIPAVSFAATPSAAQAQVFSSELSQIEAELADATTTTTFTLSPGESIQQSTSTPSGGMLTITLPSLVQTAYDPTVPPIVPQTITHYAKITLQYDPCVAVAPSVCMYEASSSYPVMTSILSQGQYTGYLHYLITLTQLSSTTATFTVTDSSLMATLQNEVQSLASQIQAFLNS